MGTLKPMLSVVLAGVMAGAAHAQPPDQEPPAPPPVEPQPPGQPAGPPVGQPETAPEPVDATDQQTFLERTLGVSGIAVFAGLGVANFVSQDMNDVTGLGAAWAVGARLNTRGRLGAELEYIGSMQDVEALGLDENADLIGTMIEGHVRFDVLQLQNLRPYALGGLGWAQYNVSDADFNTSNIEDEDSMISVPLGIGVGYQTGQLVFDARAIYRLMVFDGLVGEGGAGDDADQENITTMFTAGWEF